MKVEAMDVLTTEQRIYWDALLLRMFQYDSYHTAAFHQIAERRGEGKAHLYVFQEGGYTIALPLLLREICARGDFSFAGKGWNDATSVYGYAGPVASHPEIPAPVLERFWESFGKALLENRVVSVFTRLNPMIPQGKLLPGFGEVRSSGKTISIDLTIHPDLQRKQYRVCHQRGIRKLLKTGFVCIEDRERRYLPQFVEAYSGTMRRVSASDYYYFDLEYFESLFEKFGSAARLFVVLKGDELASGGLFLACDGILQYHLGGTVDRFLKAAPAKLIVDAVRTRATEEGLRVMHLGGGVGGREDSLFHFKSGFSDRVHEFQTWRWVSDPAAYTELCKRYNEGIRRSGLKPACEDFFPEYRCPTKAENTTEPIL